MSFPEIEVLNNHVSRVFAIEDVTAGDAKEWIVRYRGRVLGEDTVAAYDQLADSLQQYNITPLFRNAEDGRQVVLLTPTPVQPSEIAKPSTHLILFILAFFSALLMGVEIPPEVFPADGSIPLSYMLQNILTGLPFALSMMGVLSAFELGRYLAFRLTKTPASLPFFTPAPFLSPFGTLGAFILMRGTPKNKRTLFDIGVAGPLAGLAVAIPVLLYGLSISSLGPITSANSGASGILEGNSLLYLFSKYLVFGKFLPEPVNMNGLAPAIYWLKYFFSGQPIPIGGLDVQLSPVAWAGWGCLFFIMLHLVPVGALSGGHVVYGLFGEKAKGIFRAVVSALILFSILPVLLSLSLSAFNFTSLLWLVAVYWLGRARTQPLDDITPLDAKRRLLGFIVLIIFILLFTPIPLVAY